MTPGEVAYAAYVTAVEWEAVPRPILTAMWQRLKPAEQRAWDAAAQAVLEAWQTARKDAPC